MYLYLSEKSVTQHLQVLMNGVCALSLLVCSVLTCAVAQDYPSKPIRMLIPSPPAGGTDTLGRIIREGFQEMWSQPVVIDNRGGASGRIAAAQAAKANPDGYTLFFTYGGVLTSGLPLFRTLPYDPIKDFAPVAMAAHVPNILVAHPSFAPKTVAEIIKLAKAKRAGSRMAPPASVPAVI